MEPPGSLELTVCDREQAVGVFLSLFTVPAPHATRRSMRIYRCPFLDYVAGGKMFRRPKRNDKAHRAGAAVRGPISTGIWRRGLRYMTGSETTAFKAVEGAKHYPPNFRARKIAANGVPLYVRVGGAGPAVVLLHGYGETGDMWAPLWVMEENPAETIRLIVEFLAR
jgi:hypothetical protein